MSKPLKHSVSSEVVSAVSALNTEITYQGGLRDKNKQLVFIAEAEPIVGHSVEHMFAAMEVSKSIVSDLSELRQVVEHIVRKLGGWDKLPISRREAFNKSIRKIEMKL